MQGTAWFGPLVRTVRWRTATAAPRLEDARWKKGSLVRVSAHRELQAMQRPRCRCDNRGAAFQTISIPCASQSPVYPLARPRGKAKHQFFL
ncbi:MAG: hypothetical protein RSB42_08795, partial [Comamonas sp.]